MEDTETDRLRGADVLVSNSEEQAIEDILIASTRILDLEGNVYIPETAFEEAFRHIDEIRDRVGRVFIYVDNVVHRVNPPELFADLIDRTAESLGVHPGNEYLQDRLIREGVSDGLRRDLDRVYGLKKALMEGVYHVFGLNGDILEVNGNLYVSAEMFEGTSCITRSDAIDAIKPEEDSVFVLTGCGFRDGGRMVGCMGRGAGIYSHIYDIDVSNPELAEEHENRRLVVFGEEIGDASVPGRIHKRTSELADIRSRVFYHGSHKWNTRFVVGMVAARNLVDNNKAPIIDFRMIRKDGSKKHIINDGAYAIM